MRHCWLKCRWRFFDRERISWKGQNEGEESHGCKLQDGGKVTFVESPVLNNVWEFGVLPPKRELTSQEFAVPSTVHTGEIVRETVTFRSFGPFPRNYNRYIQLKSVQWFQRVAKWAEFVGWKPIPELKKPQWPWSQQCFITLLSGGHPSALHNCKDLTIRGYTLPLKTASLLFLKLLSMWHPPTPPLPVFIIFVKIVMMTEYCMINKIW